MKKRILLSSPHMSDQNYEMEYIQEAFDTNWIAPLGNNVNQFEIELANYVGGNYAVALASGTAAIHIALKLAGVGEGDVVLCQSMTFTATANPIIYQNATPVFLDSDYETWSISPESLKAAIEKYPNAKALLVVHLYGLVADMDEINKICKEHNIIVIEDAAESLGSTYKGKQTGTLADYGILSFNGNKIITTSGGGALIVNSEEEAEKAKFWATQAREKELHYEHLELGFNYRMSNVVAGIGRGQLKVLEDRVAKKREIFNLYKSELSSYDAVKMMPYNEWNEPNFWLSAFTLENGLDPIKLIEKLDQGNVESRPIWKPMHLQPFYKSYDFFGNGVSDDIYKRGICLPSDSKMTHEEQMYVISIIKDFLEGK